MKSLIKILLIGEDCKKSITLKEAMQYLSERNFIAALNDSKKVIEIDSDYYLELVWR